MTLDLGQVFGIAEATVRQLLDTGGTKVDIYRPAEGRGTGTVDPDTHVWTADLGALVHTALPALIAPLAAGGTTESLTSTPVEIGDLAVILTADVTDIREQDLIVVATCRDPRLVGRHIDVLGFTESGAGVARMCITRPRTTGPGAT